jgi:hypothetical protein
VNYRPSCHQSGRANAGLTLTNPSWFESVAGLFTSPSHPTNPLIILVIFGPVGILCRPTDCVQVPARKIYETKKALMLV